MAVSCSQNSLAETYSLGRAAASAPQLCSTCRGTTSEQLFRQAVKHNLERLRLAKQLEGENGIQKQINAQHWLGRCYLEQAKKTKEKDFKRLFEQAVECFKQQLELAKQLEGENGIRKKINAKYWLGCCDFAQAIAIKDSEDSEDSEDSKDSKDSKDSEEHIKNLFKSAAGSFLCALRQLNQLDDGKPEKKKIQRKIYRYLKEIYFLIAIWRLYFKWKKQEIQENLFEKQKSDLTDAISIILAVLNIQPIELGSIPLAHYTSPSVCEKLFGIVHDKNDVSNKEKDPIDKQQASPMRISSFTYMNDPTEGEGLLDLLNLQDLKLGK